jgi:hypothetical protein
MIEYSFPWSTDLGLHPPSVTPNSTGALDVTEMQSTAAGVLPIVGDASCVTKARSNTFRLFNGGGIEKLYWDELLSSSPDACLYLISRLN